MRAVSVAETIIAMSVALSPVTTPGCGESRAMRVLAPAREATPVQVWFSNDDPTLRYREDGEGPFPRAWPAAALVTPIDSGADLAGTLHLLAGEDLTEDNAIRKLSAATRLALPCRVAGLRGQWTSLTTHSLPVFIIVYDSGGTAGLKVEVFSRYVRYVDRTQVHFFSRDLSVFSRLPPYLGDTDGDGTLEILVSSEVANASGAGNALRTYDVWALRDGGASRVGQLLPDEVESLKKRLPL